MQEELQTSVLSSCCCFLAGYVAVAGSERPSWAGLSVQLKPDFRSEPMSRTPCLWMLKLGILKRYKKAGLYQIHFPIKIHSYPFSNNNKVGHKCWWPGSDWRNRVKSILFYSMVIGHISPKFSSSVRLRSPANFLDCAQFSSAQKSMAQVAHYWWRWCGRTFKLQLQITV